MQYGGLCGVHNSQHIGDSYNHYHGNITKIEYCKYYKTYNSMPFLTYIHLASTVHKIGYVEMQR